MAREPRSSRAEPLLPAREMGEPSRAEPSSFRHRAAPSRAEPSSARLVSSPSSIPRPAILTPGSSLGSYIVPTDQHKSFVRTLSLLMRTRENFSVGHPSQKEDAPCWYGYSINSIKPWARTSPSQGPRYHTNTPNIYHK
jgi:hypothetical protein